MALYVLKVQTAKHNFRAEYSSMAEAQENRDSLHLEDGTLPVGFARTKDGMIMVSRAEVIGVEILDFSNPVDELPIPWNPIREDDY